MNAQELEYTLRIQREKREAEMSRDLIAAGWKKTFNDSWTPPINSPVTLRNVRSAWEVMKAVERDRVR